MSDEVRKNGTDPFSEKWSIFQGRIFLSFRRESKQEKEEKKEQAGNAKLFRR